MKRMFLVTCWIFAFAIISSAQSTTFYFPHIANGVLGSPPVVWKTTIFLTNPAASGTAFGSITIQQDNANIGLAGSASSITFVDETGAQTGLPILFAIAPGQTKKYVSTGTTPYVGGYATVNTAPPVGVGVVSGTSIFSEFDSTGRLIGEAGVPQAAALPKQAIFVDTQNGYNLGVGYANPNSSSAAVTLSLLDSTGAMVASTPELIGPGNHVAKFTTELFPGAPPLAGTMQISSSVPVASIALRFDPTLSLFTTLPPVSIASLLSPAFAWLEQHGGSHFSPIVRLLETFRLRV
jgi:hypothetical protein